MIVEESVDDTFLEQLVEKVKTIAVGNGLSESTRMGPVAGPKQFKTINEYIEIGKREGRG